MQAQTPLLPDEAQIVARAAAGDRRAFEKLYRAYAHLIYRRVLLPMTCNEADAQDALREGFINAWGAIDRFEYREVGIYPWLKKLCKNRALDLLRARSRRSRLRGAFSHHLEALGGDPDDPVANSMHREVVRGEIDQLLETINPRYARVLRMRLLEGRDREECAEELDVKIGTLDVLLHRACKAFRVALEKRPDSAAWVGREALLPADARAAADESEPNAPERGGATLGAGVGEAAAALKRSAARALATRLLSSCASSWARLCSRACDNARRFGAVLACFAGRTGKRRSGFALGAAS